jgi:hypothetical protein
MMTDMAYPTTVVKVLDSVMKAQLAYSEADGEYREHFIHSFQVFLLGMIIVDNYYELFRNWLSPQLRDEPRTSLESGWLLASTFHDHMKPVNPLLNLVRKIVRTREESVESLQIPEGAPELVDLIDTAYGVMNSGGHLEGNLPSPGQRSALWQVLDEYAKKGNHGVVAGINVLDWIRGSGQLTSTDVIAALAIALHDSDYKNKRALPRALLQAGVFPVNFAGQPLACLLLWCDAIQEWGRWTRKIDVDTRLVSLAFHGHTINTVLSFEDRDVIKDKRAELRDIRECVEESDLKFKTRFKTHPSGLGNV